MIEGWEEKRLGDTINLKRGYDLPMKHRVDGEIPIFSSSGVSGLHAEAKAAGPGVITGRYGTIGSVFYSKGPFWPLNTTLYVQDFKGNNPRFVYYFLQTLNWEKFNDKSAVPGVNRNDVHDEPVTFPLPNEQGAIAELLSSLDDKIDLLYSQNVTLEALAETLFRQFFIEKAQGDWEEGTLDDVLTVKGGTTPSTNNTAFWDGDIHWTSPKDLSANDGLFLLDTARKITPEGLAQIGSGLLPAGSLLMSSRAPVGYLAFSFNPVAINQGYIGILDDKGFSKEFIFLWLKINMEYVKGHANGSTFQEISKSTFKRLEITKPPEQLRKEFQGLVLPLFQKLLENTLQCRKLRQLRDTLLPKLMSGQVRVDVSA